MDLAELLRRIVAIWSEQIKLAGERKYAQFGETAQQLWSFVGKSYRQLYLETGEGSERFANLQGPYYKARINKTAEAISLLVPYVMAEVPHRQVSAARPPLAPELLELLPTAEGPREIIDKTDRLVAYLLQWFLNYTPREYGLRREARTALIEAFGKGRGVLWHEMADAPAGLLPASYFDTVDGLLIDPDAIQLREAGFIIRKRTRSVWKVSQDTGLPREQLRGHSRSAMQTAIDRAATKTEPEVGAAQQKDVITYYEVYSRIGIGHWLDRDTEELKPLAEALDSIGPYVYLEIVPGVDYPLNLAPGVVASIESQDELRERLAWPIKFYAETAGNPWPCSVIDFIPNPDNPWATSVLQGGLALQIFLDHLYSFIMSRVRVSSKNVGLYSNALSQETIDAIKHGFDLQLAGVPGKPGDEIKSLLHFIEFPQLNADLWKVLQLAEGAYENATGLVPLLYGTEGARQIRTAKESGIREAHASTRPDDYADATEEWLSNAAAKEGQAARLHVRAATVGPLFGEPLPPLGEDGSYAGGFGPLTEAWQNLVATDDEWVAASEFAYTVAAGSARRKNKAKLLADMQQMIQVMMQPAGEMASAQNVEPWNALMHLIGEALEQPVLMQRFMLAPGQMPTQETEGAKV